MKNKILIFLFLVIGNFAFGQLTIFNYDAAGNQITVYVEISFTPASKMNSTSTLQNNPIYKDVKYYPNPVNNELYMEWETIDNNVLNNISVFNVQGVLIKEYKDLNTINSYTLSFQDYSQGIYLVEFYYSNGEQKTFKIIKQ